MPQGLFSVGMPRKNRYSCGAGIKKIFVQSTFPFGVASVAEQ